MERLTPTLPGSGGVLRSAPADFEVHEVLAYAPSGAGEHVFVEIEKIGLTTLEVVARIAELARVDRRAVGYAGMKDRHAVARQWLSVPVPIAAPMPDWSSLERPGALRVLSAARHSGKVRRGHARANRFAITLREVPDGGVARARAVLAALRGLGVPNRFGPQRFGMHGDNADRALAFLRGRERLPPNPRLRELFFSALQSRVFNDVLDRRIAAGTLTRALLGDVMQKHDTGGLFDVTDPEAEQPRVDRLEISPTAALPGKRVRHAAGVAQAIEDEAYRAAGLLEEDLARMPDGTRRALRFPLDPDAAVDELDERSYRATFVLPSGAYATVVLDELVKPAGGPFDRSDGEE